MSKNDAEQAEEERYSAFKGLGITPMIGGVPLMMALGLVGVVLLAMVFLVLKKTIVSITLIVAAIAIYFMFKVACENNNKAPQALKRDMFGFFNILKYGKIIKVDLGVENEQEKREKFQRKFKCLFESK